MKKKFIVVVESSPDGRTRWLTDGQLLADLLTLAIARIVKSNTRGPLPRVTVKEDR